MYVVGFLGINTEGLSNQYCSSYERVRNADTGISWTNLKAVAVEVDNCRRSDINL